MPLTDAPSVVLQLGPKQRVGFGAVEHSLDGVGDVGSCGVVVGS